MKLGRSLTIENKILAAVLGICLLSVLCFGFLMIYEGYQSKLTQERDKGQELISYISWDIQQFGNQVGQEAILAGCAALENKSLIIFDMDGNRILGTDDAEVLAADDGVLTERSDNVFGWRLCYIIDEMEFENSLVEEQKYAILATIALLIVTVEVGVFVSYGISEPVRRLAEACVLVREHPQQATADLIPSDVRGAETRQLAEAFRRMLGELQQYNAALAEQKALNESIVTNLPIGVAAYNADGQVLCVNEKAVAMLADEEFTSAGQTLRMVLERHLAQGSVPHAPIRMENSTGDGRTYQIGVWRLWRGGAGTGTLCTIDDVTYDKIMEEKVSESEKLAFTGKLAAMLAHEIRNPLAGIRASIQVISHGLTRERDQILCTSIVREVDRINVLIEDLLNLSRKRESCKTMVGLRGLFSEVALLYSKIAENHSVVIDARAEPGLALYADESELKQVLVNLVSNSLKALVSGGKIMLRATGGPEGIELEVTDNGVGMDVETLHSVQNGIASGGGTGRYGLAIVSRLLEQNGGGLQIVSSPGKGTCIHMKFCRMETVEGEEKETI